MTKYLAALFAIISTAAPAQPSVQPGSGPVPAGAAAVTATGGATARTLTNWFWGMDKVGSQFLVAPATPPWATLTTIEDAFRIQVGTCPATQEWGGNTAGLVTGLASCVSIPSAMTSAVASFGLVGYGDTSSMTHGIVGIGGFTNTTIDGSQAWGGNVGVSNCSTRTCTGANDGHTNATLYGLEVDVNIDKTSVGTTPNANVRGLWLTGGSTVDTSNYYAAAVDIGAMGTLAAPTLPWHQGVLLDDGAAQTALLIGTSAVGNNVGSMPIQFNSRTSGGVGGNSQIFSDATGSFYVRSVSGSSIYLQSGGTTVLSLSPTAISTSVPMTINGLLQVNGTVALGQYLVAGLPACAPASKGQFAAVTDATAPTYNGTLTGGGSVSVPVYCNGTAWTAH